MASLNERTQIVVSLGHVAAAAIAIVLAHGAWTWALQKEIEEVKRAVAKIEAAVVPAPTAYRAKDPGPMPKPPDPEPSAFAPAAVVDRRHFRGYP